MNLLVTSAGPHVYLVEAFQTALGGRGRVFAADAEPSAPALARADGAFLSPPSTHPGYLDALLEVCERARISLLVPLGDADLPLLAEADARSRFGDLGTRVIVSSPEVVSLCFDKWATHEFLRRAGLVTPKTYTSLVEARHALRRGELTFPLAVKRRWQLPPGGLEFAHDEEELELSYLYLQKRLFSSRAPEGELLVQEYIAGDAYQLEVVSDLFYRYVATFVTRKLGRRAGETDSAVTVRSGALESLGKTLSRELKHIGPLTCDVLVNEKGAWVLELSPRFGSGYPFSHLAGANLPAALIAWARGDTVDESWLRTAPGVIASKYSCVVRVGAE